MAQILTETQQALKLAIEAETNGEQTIIFTETGQPSFMYKFKKFDLSEINPNWSGTHPAFMINGVEKDYLYIGVYSGVVKNGEIVSQPNQNPTIGVTTGTQAQQTGIALCGAGFHMMTYDESAAIALICRKNNWFSFGQTHWEQIEYGAYSKFGGPLERGRYIDSPITGIPFIYTGSGTVNFRHNLKYTGISDLVGNQHNRVVGARLINGELHVIDPNLTKDPKNNDLSKNSSLWKAINATTGDLIERTFTGTIADSTYTPTTPNSIRFGQYASNTTIGVLAENSPFALEVLDYSLINPQCVNKLQQLGILSTTKFANTSSYGKTWNDISIRYSVNGQYIPGTFSCLDMIRGGGINSENVGIDSYNFDFPDDIGDINVTCRPCYYE